MIRTTTIAAGLSVVLADSRSTATRSLQFSAVTAIAVAAALAPLVSAPLGNADLGVCPSTARSCPAIEQQLLADMDAAGIDQDPVHQDPGGLISGARNTVCPELDEGKPEASITAELEGYSKFRPAQADVYIRDAVRFYCPGDAGRLS